MRNWIKNQYVVLSGASGGIGKELCKILIKKYNAKVIGIGRNAEKMQKLYLELEEYADNFSYELFDVSDANEWINFKNRLIDKQISPLMLINNAGVFPTFNKALDVSQDVFEKIIQTNYLSVVYGVKQIAPILKSNGKHKPAIINVSSSAALCTIVGTSAYSASKSAVKGFTEALMLEEKNSKYVGIIYPGTTATDLFRNDEKTVNSALDKIAMPASKMAKKIAKRIIRKKRRSVVGWDARLMNFTAKIMPVKGPSLICKVMRAAKSKVFSEVFDYDKKS